MRTAAALTATLLACATAGERAPAAPERIDEEGLATRCDRGFAAGCRTLGRARLSGDAGPRDDRLAAALLAAACEIGDPAACSDVGVLYAIGRGVPQSDERAAALARRACDQGAASACSNQGALLAEGAGSPADASDVGVRAVRLFRTACDAGVAEGCTNLGTALESGRLTAPDLKASARAQRRACEAGFALACHRLALLVADHPDAAPDLTAIGLDARACRAGIAPACWSVSEATPPRSVATPAAHLVDERGSFVVGIPGTGGFSPAELAAVRTAGHARSMADARRPPFTVQVGVPPALRERLGVDGPARDPDPADHPVELLVALRRHQLGQCYEAPRGAPETPAEAFATFLVDRDGRPSNLKVATVPSDAPLAECVAAVVGAWEFPADPGGFSGPYLARHAYDAAPGPRPQFTAPGGLRPSLRDPGCVERGLRVPPEYRGSTGSVTVKLAVDAAGKPGLVHALTPVPDPILSAVAAAVLRCAWTPGGDAEGRPLPSWVTLTVNLERR